MKSIPFFTDDIVIIPHSATNAKHIGKSISLKEFSNGERISLYETDSGELLARKPDGKFIEGPEA